MSLEVSLLIFIRLVIAECVAGRFYISREVCEVREVIVGGLQNPRSAEF